MKYWLNVKDIFIKRLIQNISTVTREISGGQNHWIQQPSQIAPLCHQLKMFEIAFKTWESGSEQTVLAKLHQALPTYWQLHQ